MDKNSTQRTQSGRSPINPPQNTTLVFGGLLLLLIGVFLGYIGRGSFGPEVQTARTTATAEAGLVQTRSAANKQVMELISQQITHWLGDEKAPITMIEISDYQ